MQVLLGL
jgi:signal transduction histidine kinase